MLCKKCGTELVNESKFCISCGCAVEGQGHIAKIKNLNSNSSSKNEEPNANNVEKEDFPTEELVMHLGGNSEYFKSQFSKLENGEVASFNWAAFFLNGMYCLYRKEYEAFKKYLLIPLMGWVLYFVGVIVFIMNVDFITLFNSAPVIFIIYFAILAWMIVMYVRLGKDFNKIYYQTSKGAMKKKNYAKLKPTILNPIIFVVSVCVISWLMTSMLAVSLQSY